MALFGLEASPDGTLFQDVIMRFSVGGPGAGGRGGTPLPYHTFSHGDVVLISSPSAGGPCPHAWGPSVCMCVCLCVCVCVCVCGCVRVGRACACLCVCMCAHAGCMRVCVHPRIEP